MEPIYKCLLNRKTKMAVIGLGYVGMPLAVAFSKKMDVIGYDKDEMKLENYKRGDDPAGQISGLKEICKNIELTSDRSQLWNAKVYIIAVPTPIQMDSTPDLEAIKNATIDVGACLKKGDYIIYESTVYPGMTEEVCIPLLEKTSSLKCGKDFFVGYSPERVNPCDALHGLESVVKIVSGLDEQTTTAIEEIYNTILPGRTFKVSSIKIAETAKVVENTQRDINIAFMNEVAMALEKMDIPMDEVISAMSTKWNALDFKPGLVGGHCISVDPYYFIAKAKTYGACTRLISIAREVNEGVADFIVQRILKLLIQKNKMCANTKIGFLGITFKENCPDIRNSKAIEIVRGLEEYGIRVDVTDPYANPEKTLNECGIRIWNLSDISNVDCIVVAVAHDKFKNMQMAMFDKMYKKGSDERIFVDIKCAVKEMKNRKKYIYWNF